VGKVTKSTPFGSVDRPFDPVALALGAAATFVARTIDNDRQHLTEVLRQAAAHPGAAFVEIYQNCNVFNDGAFDLLRDKPQGAHNQIRLVHGEPIVFDEGTRCVRAAANGRLEIADVADSDPASIITHDVHGPPSLAFTLAHLSQGPTEPTCMGVFREVERDTYGEAIHAQLDRATERLGPGELAALLHGGDTWTVE
jgi:2-oxoglutarate ferredoxin oxidoreductase subunit beta